ncbi:hypothetical protein ACFLQL_02960, partial [Verrucomicrobiota bacterium]
MKKVVCCSLLSLAALTCFAGELIIAESNQCNYQIVVSDKSTNSIIKKTLANAGDVMREMFKANGWTNVPVVNESQADKDKPGIYLGDTAVARAGNNSCLSPREIQS